MRMAVARCEADFGRADRLGHGRPMIAPIMAGAKPLWVGLGAWTNVFPEATR